MTKPATLDLSGAFFIAQANYNRQMAEQAKRSHVKTPNAIKPPVHHSRKKQAPPPKIPPKFVPPDFATAAKLMHHFIAKHKKPVPGKTGTLEAKRRSQTPPKKEREISTRESLSAFWGSPQNAQMFAEDRAKKQAAKNRDLHPKTEIKHRDPHLGRGRTKRHVRTPAGVKRYDKPIGAELSMQGATVDLAMPKKYADQLSKSLANRKSLSDDQLKAAQFLAPAGSAYDSAFKKEIRRRKAGGKRHVATPGGVTRYKKPIGAELSNNTNQKVDLAFGGKKAAPFKKGEKQRPSIDPKKAAQIRAKRKGGKNKNASAALAEAQRRGLDLANLDLAFKYKHGWIKLSDAEVEAQARDYAKGRGHNYVSHEVDRENGIIKVHTKDPAAFNKEKTITVPLRTPRQKRKYQRDQEAGVTLSNEDTGARVQLVDLGERHVRTPAGVKRYNKPIGSPIGKSHGPATMALPGHVLRAGSGTVTVGSHKASSGKKEGGLRAGGREFDSHGSPKPLTSEGGGKGRTKAKPTAAQRAKNKNAPAPKRGRTGSSKPKNSRVLSGPAAKAEVKRQAKVADSLVDSDWDKVQSGKESTRTFIAKLLARAPFIGKKIKSKVDSGEITEKTSKHRVKEAINQVVAAAAIDIGLRIVAPIIATGVGSALVTLGLHAFGGGAE